jgi:hypothetical protein
VRGPVAARVAEETKPQLSFVASLLTIAILLYERTILCTHQVMPTPRKRLPRPCPQCGSEFGGCQLVMFNPRFYHERTGYERHYPYVIIRINHGYSKTEKTKNNTRKKIVHNFSSERGWSFITDSETNPDTVSSEEIFNRLQYRYRQSYTMPLGPEAIQSIKENGWKISEKSLAHWVRRSSTKMKICQRCQKATKTLEEYHRLGFPCKLKVCNACKAEWLKLESGIENSYIPVTVR